MQRQDSCSKPIRVVGGLAFLAAAAIAWFVFKPVHNPAPPQDSNITASQEQPAAAPQAAQSAAERAKALQAPAVIQPISRPAIPTAAPAVPRTEPTAYTRQLVAGLTNLDFSRGPITKEQ